jgi:exosortase
VQPSPAPLADTAVVESVPVAAGRRLTASLVLGIGAAFALLLWAYWPILPPLVRQWWNEDQYSHGFLIPAISGWLVWVNRKRLAAAPISTSYAGLVVIAGAALTYMTGIVGADLFLQRFSMVLMVAGGVLFVAGWAIFRVLLFPLAYLLLMIPLPGIIFNSIAFPLQLFAAQIASGTMSMCAVPVFREGNVMHLAAASLDVEEACSGIRSLISLTALGALYAYLTETRLLARLLIVALVVPIAIAANVLRVTVTGLLAHYVSVETAMDIFHTAGGFVVLGLAAALLFSVGGILRKIGVLR